jgi:hypothetical protein
MTVGTLPVTPILLHQFESAIRAMDAQERKPLSRRDPRAAIRVYGMAEVLATMLTAAGREVDGDDPQDVLHELALLAGQAAREDPAGALRTLAETNREEG